VILFPMVRSLASHDREESGRIKIQIRDKIRV
jgi:hypothetical protein